MKIAHGRERYCNFFSLLHDVCYIIRSINCLLHTTQPSYSSQTCGHIAEIAADIARQNDIAPINSVPARYNFCYEDKRYSKPAARMCAYIQ